MQITSLFGTPQHESESFVKRQSATFAAELNRNSRVLSSSATINNLLAGSFKMTDAEKFTFDLSGVRTHHASRCSCMLGPDRAAEPVPVLMPRSS